MSTKGSSTYRILLVIAFLVLGLLGCKATNRSVPATTQGMIATLQGHTRGISSVAFAPNGTILASGSLDTTVRLWDVAEGAKVATLYGHPDQVNSVTFSPDGTLLASGNGTYLGSTGHIRNREGATPFMLQDGTPLPLPNMVILWDVATAAEKMHWDEFETAFWTVAFSPDGGTLAAGSGTPTGVIDDAVRLWDVATGELKTRREQPGTVWSVSFSPDGRTLAAGTHNKIVLEDVTIGEVRASLSRGAIRSVAFSPDGTLLASGNAGGAISLWNMTTYQERAELGEHDGIVYALAFSPDGKMLASAGEDGVVHLWDVMKEKEMKTIRIPETWVGGVAFSPDGALLATGSSDGLIRLWNVAEVLNQ